MPRRVLFVCDANRCRSPLAQVILAMRATERKADVAADSAGLHASAGEPATREAAMVAHRISAVEDVLKDHRSKPVDEALLGGADLVVLMTREQLRELQERFPGEAKKAYTLGELAGGGDVPDPYGQPAFYWTVGVDLRKMIDAAFPRLVGRAPLPARR